MKTLAQEMDQIGFELIKKNQPTVIEAIEQAIAAGGTARQIERGINKRFGKHSLTGQLVIGAAYYLEQQQKQQANQ